MKEQLKELLGDAFIIMCGGICLFTLVAIWLYGGITYIEQNRTILMVEIIASILIILFGSGRMKKDLNRKRV